MSRFDRWTERALEVLALSFLAEQEGLARIDAAILALRWMNMEPNENDARDILRRMQANAELTRSELVRSLRARVSPDADGGS